MCPSNEDKTSMSASALVKQLENRTASRIGRSVAVARGVVARRLKVAPGTLENLRKGRGKDASGETVIDKIRKALIDELQREIQALTHEVEVLRRSGHGPDSNQILEAETLLAKAREIIRGT